MSEVSIGSASRVVAGREGVGRSQDAYAVASNEERKRERARERREMGGLLAGDGWDETDAISRSRGSMTTQHRKLAETAKTYFGHRHNVWADDVVLVYDSVSHLWRIGNGLVLGRSLLFAGSGSIHAGSFTRRMGSFKCRKFEILAQGDEGTCWIRVQIDSTIKCTIFDVERDDARFVQDPSLLHRHCQRPSYTLVGRR
jgi:hypothetical protein